MNGNLTEIDNHENDLNGNIKHKISKSKNHAGQVLESIIRKKGHNISELARHMKISRCTIYNWFELELISYDILVKIGSYINYDFSSDFPDVFSGNNNVKFEPNKFTEPENVDYWIKKYIILLEKYNECLLSKNYNQEYINQ